MVGTVILEVNSKNLFCGWAISGVQDDSNLNSLWYVFTLYSNFKYIILSYHACMAFSRFNSGMTSRENLGTIQL